MFIPKAEERHYYCFKCGQEIDFDRIKMARTDTCPHCNWDLHACKNCEYWDPGYHNQCRERIAEYIADRERINYCTHFLYRNGKFEAVGDANSAKAKLNALFK
jgi:hypothetical protein